MKWLCWIDTIYTAIIAVFNLYGSCSQLIFTLRLLPPIYDAWSNKIDWRWMDICVSPHARRYKSIIRFKIRTLINPCLYTVIWTTCQLYLQKTNSDVLAFIRIAQVCNLKIVQNIYFAYIHSQHIFWDWSLWCCNSQKFRKNFVSSRIAISNVLCLKWQEPADTEHFKILGSMTIYGLYVYRLILLM